MNEIIYKVFTLFRRKKKLNPTSLHMKCDEKTKGCLCARSFIDWKMSTYRAAHVSCIVLYAIEAVAMYFITVIMCTSTRSDSVA